MLPMVAIAPGVEADGVEHAVPPMVGVVPQEQAAV